MDIFSHGLWSAAASKNLNIKKKLNINLYIAAFWGMFPDLFAFTPAFAWIIWMKIKGVETLAIRPENADSLEQSGGGPFYLSHTLYNYSHSLFVFIGVSLVVLAIIYLRNKSVSLKDLPLAMIGWPLHIIMDIPTHSYKFYPTPFLWPFSNWKFNGFSWGQLWFIVLNYGMLILAFRYLKKRSVNNN